MEPLPPLTSKYRLDNEYQDFPNPPFHNLRYPKHYKEFASGCSSNVVKSTSFVFSLAVAHKTHSSWDKNTWISTLISHYINISFFFLQGIPIRNAHVDCGRTFWVPNPINYTSPSSAAPLSLTTTKISKWRCYKYLSICHRNHVIGVEVFCGNCGYKQCCCCHWCKPSLPPPPTFTFVCTCSIPALLSSSISIVDTPVPSASINSGPSDWVAGIGGNWEGIQGTTAKQSFVPTLLSSSSSADFMGPNWLDSKNWSAKNRHTNY